MSKPNPEYQRGYAAGRKRWRKSHAMEIENLQAAIRQLVAITEDFALRDFVVHPTYGRVNVPQPNGSMRQYTKADIQAAIDAALHASEPPQ